MYIVKTTTKQREIRKYERKQAKENKLQAGVIRFAYWFVRLDDGRIILWDAYILKKEVNDHWTEKPKGVWHHYREIIWHKLPIEEATSTYRVGKR